MVPPLVTALWPVLWQRWLKDVENAGIDVLRHGRLGGTGAVPARPVPGVAGRRRALRRASRRRPVDVDVDAERPAVGGHGALDPRASSGRPGRRRAPREAQPPARTSTACSRSSDACRPAARSDRGCSSPSSLIALLRAVALGEDPRDVVARVGGGGRRGARHRAGAPAPLPGVRLRPARGTRPRGRARRAPSVSADVVGGARPGPRGRGPGAVPRPAPASLAAA